MVSGPAARRRAPGMRGLSLVEVLLAVVLFALVGLSVHQLLGAAAQGTARGTELQLASVMGARVVDRLLSTGYGSLARLVRTGVSSGDLDLSSLGEASDEKAPDPTSLVADGLVYSGTYRLDEAGTGLLRIRIVLAWKRHGPAAGIAPGNLLIVRYVADPSLALASNEPFGRSR